MNEVKFVYGKYEKYRELETKDSDTLYFLDNHEVYKGDKLMSVLHTVETFPETPDEDMVDNYYVCIKSGSEDSGRIRYVNSNQNYIDVTSLLLDSIKLDTNFLKECLSKVTKELTITTPLITVKNDTLKMSNMEDEQTFTVLSPK